jgi:two-component system, probable response regulator PhcQ
MLEKPMTTNNTTVLLVDDEPQVTEGLKRALRRESYELLSATSADEAGKVLASRRVDVVVSDEQMPGKSGSAFLAQVKTQFPHTIRIILTGQASLEAAIRAINDGEVYRFFLKPCNPIDLIHTINQAVDHKRLEEQSRRLLREFQKQAAVLAKMKEGTGALMHLDVDEQGAVVLDEANEEGELNDLISEIELAIKGR